MSWSKRELQCVFDLFFFSCAPRAPQNQCWHREASCFSSTWSRTHARSTLNGGGRGDGSTTWKSEVKYWPLLWVASSFLSKSSDPIETCRALYDSDTMLDHACAWARACVALLIARNSQWHTLPSHIYHRNHPAYSTHSVNTQYTLSRHYNKHTVNTCKNWEIWSMWVLTYSLLHYIVASKVDAWRRRSYILPEFTVCLL